MATNQAAKAAKKRMKRVARPAVFGKTFWAYVYILPVFFFLSIFTYYAMGFNIHTAFYDWNGVSADKTFVGFKNFINLFKDPYFKVALKNTALFFITTIPVQALFGFLLAYAFTKKLYLKGLARSIIFLPNVMALVVIGYVFSQMYNYQIGFLNELLRNIGLDSLARDWTGDPKFAIWSVIVANIFTYTGFSMTLYVSGMLGIPHDVMEAARIDGAGEAQIMRRISLPLLMSTHITIIIMGIVGTLKTFDIVWLITKGGPARSSEMLATLLYRSYILEYKAGYASAIAVVILIIALILSSLNLYIQRRSAE